VRDGSCSTQSTFIKKPKTNEPSLPAAQEKRKSCDQYGTSNRTIITHGKGEGHMSEGIGSIQEVLENYRQAVNKRDSDAFLSAYSTDVHIYDCWGSWECKGKDAWRENVLNWFNG
jgi:hypothetical protein